MTYEEFKKLLIEKIEDNQFTFSFDHKGQLIIYTDINPWNDERWERE